MMMTEIRLEVVICSADHIDRIHYNNIDNDDDSDQVRSCDNVR